MPIVDATDTNRIVFSLTQPMLESKIYRIRCEHADHYTTDPVMNNFDNKGNNKITELRTTLQRESQIS